MREIVVTDNKKSEEKVPSVQVLIRLTRTPHHLHEHEWASLFNLRERNRCLKLAKASKERDNRVGDNRVRDDEGA